MTDPLAARLAGASGPVQIAYLVPDVVMAALSHSRTFGSGPFFVASHIPLASAHHDGRDCVLDHSSAYGQWGAVMVEMIALHACEPATLAAAVRCGPPGLHHVARFVDDLQEESTSLEAAGYRQVLIAGTASGERFSWHDGGPLGHLLEIYEPSPRLEEFYRRVAEASSGWDGRDPIRPV